MQKRRRIFWLWAGLGVAVVAANLAADSLTLRDGSIVAGLVKQVDGGYDVTLDDSKHRFIAAEDVKSLKLSNEGKVTDASARERLASLERSVESERDLGRIIERYEQFISMNAGTEAAKAAQTKANEWRERRDQRMLKVGHRWLTPSDRDAMLIAAAKTVDDVCAEIANGELDHAAITLRDASTDDPDNVSYAYLNGVVQLRRERYSDAKRSFDAVAASLSDHPPTILNLSVLAVQFKRWPQAVTYLEQAMLLAPGSSEILDDVLELGELVPDSTRRTGGFERLIKRAAPLEAALEARQAQRGLFRLGSKWVDQAAIDKAKLDREAYDKKKADLESDYQATQETLRKTQENIGLTQRLIARIEQESLVQDANGNVVRLAYPQAYYDLQRDLALLQGQQQAANNHVADLRKQADAMKANQPRPPFDGKLTPIDQRGVPVMLPARAIQAATTQTALPTTLPTTMPTTPSTTMPAMIPTPEASPATEPSKPSTGLFD